MKYYLLTRTDTIQSGDEHLCDDCETWEPVTGLFIGMMFSPIVMVPVRRLVE